MKVGRGVFDFIRSESSKMALAKPMVVITDCGCMLNGESVEVDLKEYKDEQGLEPYFEMRGVRFMINPKIKQIADGGSLRVVSYGAGKFRRLEFSPGGQGMSR